MEEETSENASKPTNDLDSQGLKRKFNNMNKKEKKKPTEGLAKEKRIKMSQKNREIKNSFATKVIPFVIFFSNYHFNLIRKNIKKVNFIKIN
jgi:hypothetical protein